MVYLASWLASLASALALFVKVPGRRIPILLSVLVVCALITFRGNVGTDTAIIYEPMARIMANMTVLEVATHAEPAFTLLLAGFRALTQSDVLAVRLMGLVFSVLVLLLTIRADRDELAIIGLIIIPGLIFPLGLNAIRLGIAVALILLAVQALKRRKYTEAVILTCLAPLFHLSSLLILALLWLMVPDRLLQKRYVALSVTGIIAAFAIGVLALGYLEQKFELYTEYLSPSPLSGISSVLSGLMLILCIVSLRIAVQHKLRIVLTSVVGLTAMFVLSRFSYAGLRFLELIVIAMVAFVVYAFRGQGGQSRVTIALLLITGVMMAAFDYRNFLASRDSDVSPFIPYEWLSIAQHIPGL